MADGGSLQEMIGTETTRARRQRAGWIIGAVLGVAAIVFAAWYFRPRGLPLEQRFRQVEVQRDTVQRVVSANGRLGARSEVEVGAEISGRIAEVLVKHEEEVQLGQVLATFDTESLEAQVAQAEANVRVARANLARARVDHSHAKTVRSRSESLHQRGVESDARLQEAQTGAERARVAVESAAAQLQLQRASRTLALATLRDAEIRAPIAGVVIRVDIDAGQTVATSLQAPTLFVIAEDLAKMRVTTNIDEADIGQISVGQPATFTVDAFAGRKFAAQLSEVRSAAEVVQNVVTYEAILDVENPDGALRPGMTASVKIETGRIEGQLVVPSAALRFVPPGEPSPLDDHPGVFVLDDGELSRRAVEPVLSGDTRSAVHSDALVVGEKVVIGLTPEGKEAYEKEQQRGD
jgi:HlyD family secretion protein